MIEEKFFHTDAGDAQIEAAIRGGYKKFSGMSA